MGFFFFCVCSSQNNSKDLFVKRNPENTSDGFSSLRMEFTSYNLLKSAEDEDCNRFVRCKLGSTENPRSCKEYLASPLKKGNFIL